MNRGSILILTAAFGEGHHAAARNLQAALLERSPETRVEVRDIFCEAYNWRYEIARKSYTALINHLPALWNQAFELMDKTRTVSAGARLLFLATKRLLSLLREMQPAVVISVFPGYGPLLHFLCEKRLEKDFKIITLITDSISVNSLWYRSHSDVFITPNIQTSAVLERAGIFPGAIRSLGFPVPTIFARTNTEKAPPIEGQKWKILYMVNATYQQAPSIVKYLWTLKNAAITVTVGKNSALAKRLRRLSQAEHQPLEIQGWIPDMPELIARSHVLIGKAGGATVQEALAARTPLLLTQVIPGQEEGNARLVLEHRAGTFASKGPVIAAKLELAFEKEGLLWKEWYRGASSLSRPRAAFEIADFVLLESK